MYCSLNIRQIYFIYRKYQEGEIFLPAKGNVTFFYRFKPIHPLAYIRYVFVILSLKYRSIATKI